MKTIVHVISRPNCPYCEKAKEFLDEMEAPFEVEMLNPNDAEAYAVRRDQLVTKTGAKTFPFIFLEGTFLGGFQQLVHANDTGRLAEVYRRHGIEIKEVTF